MNVNVIVLGGGPAGIITALTAKSVYPEKSVCVIKEIGDSVIPCAIPYMMHTLSDPKQNAMGNMPLEKAGIDIIVGKVVSFDPKAHSVTLESGQVLNYERLVLATGTEPVLPPIPGIEKIDGNSRVESVTLDNGGKIQADMVLVSIGAKPASDLAQKADLRIVENGSIWVDEYMRTDAVDVFAVGDCAVKRDFFTRKAAPIWLASTATAEARNAGTNIYGIRVLHQIQGTISAFSTKIGDVSFASAGMTCRACQKEGFRYVTATAVAPDRHPGMLPGASELKVKLVFADRSGIILGGQVSGGPSTGELINMIALAIQKKVTVRELDMLQIATHPLLTSSPTVHPLINAAHQALAKLRVTNRGLSPLKKVA